MLTAGSTITGSPRMPRIKLTKTAIDGLPTKATDIVHWDSALPGFGVKVTPKGRKVFIVLYRTGGAGSKLRKYTIGPYGKVTLHQAKVAAQQVFAAKFEGRDPAAEKREAARKQVVDRVDDLLGLYITQHVSKNRSAAEISRLLRREIGQAWGSRSIHNIRKRDIVEVIWSIEQRGAPIAANKVLKSIKTFLTWCVGRAVLEKSPAEGIPLPAREVSRDRVLDDRELSRILLSARLMGGPYSAIVEFLALTGQRREEVAQLTWPEIDQQQGIWTIPGIRTKNGKPHIVHLSKEALTLLKRSKQNRPFVFSHEGVRPFNRFSHAKRKLDQTSGVANWRLHDLRRTCVSGMARLGIPPHVADKILNHQSGTISGVAAVYQRHDFLVERKAALQRWATHVASLRAPQSPAFANRLESPKTRHSGLLAGIAAHTG
jgi:integrase